MMRSLIRYPFLERELSFQMALDEIMLERAVQLNHLSLYLRFYRSHFGTTIGFSQRKTELIQALRRSQSIWVRRITGGGVVEHGNDLIFSICLPSATHRSMSLPADSYRLIHGWIKKALSDLGIHTDWKTKCQDISLKPDRMQCFRHPICDDLLIGKEKVVGGAQKRSRGYLLHQGSLQLVKQTLSNEQTAQLIKSFSEIVATALGVTVNECSINAADMMDAEALARTKYQSTLWNEKGQRELVSHLHCESVN